MNTTPQGNEQHSSHIPALATLINLGWTLKKSCAGSWSASGVWYSSKLNRRTRRERTMTEMIIRRDVSSWMRAGCEIAKLNEQMDGYLKELGYGA
ncbi:MULTISPECIES: hypothetical protein [unclassified Marinobacter]|uniref:hypothetical protein n=1 Tax=unclassified Marinobacter TaxID=83889 RepID=UPI0018F17BD2|nr:MULTISPECIES: hypothetical protein [unclassified Marinobacter]